MRQRLRVPGTRLTNVSNQPTVPAMNTVASQSAIIIDGLSLSVTSDALREMLSPYGSVVWCRIAVDRWGNSLRYGYVVMDTGAQRSEGHRSTEREDARRSANHYRPRSSPSASTHSVIT